MCRNENEVVTISRKGQNLKNNRMQKNFEDKMASPAKRLKCSCDLLAFISHTVYLKQGKCYDRKIFNCF